MNKNIWIILFIILILIVGFIVFFYINNNNQNTNNLYEANKTSITNITNDNISNEKQKNETSNNEQSSNQRVGISDKKIVEQQLSTFSTKIYSQDSARQNNVNITCDKLNGTTIQNGETFSFCNTIGPSTISKGYQEADIFDNKGNKKKGLGGGNCQISSTLYNAVLAVPSIIVTERHEHSNNVPYVAKGKDAAVAYGSYDLKFVNRTGNAIKIEAKASKSDVTVNIISLIPQS